MGQKVLLCKFYIIAGGSLTLITDAYREITFVLASLSIIKSADKYSGGRAERDSKCHLDYDKQDGCSCALVELHVHLIS